MGLDAQVYCNCWKLGLTSPPPVPREQVIFDPERWISLASSYEGHEVEHDAFYEWLESCCTHPNMEYCSVRVSNWWGYRAFQGALERAGWEHFPTLRDELPEGNGGSMSSLSAAKVLDELDYFRRNAEIGKNIFLVDSETGEWVQEYSAASGGIFVWNDPSQVNIGFDERGLFIVTSSKDALRAVVDATHHVTQPEQDAPGADLFRAMRLEQRLLEPGKTESSGAGRVEFINLDNGTRFVCTTEVSGKQIPWPDGRMQNDDGRVRTQYPRYLHVEERPLSTEHFSHILDALTEVCRASVETGNAVLWC